MIRTLIASFLQILVRLSGRAIGVVPMPSQAVGFQVSMPTVSNLERSSHAANWLFCQITDLMTDQVNHLDERFGRGRLIAKPKFTELIGGMAGQRSGRSAC